MERATASLEMAPAIPETQLKQELGSRLREARKERTSQFRTLDEIQHELSARFDYEAAPSTIYAWEKGTNAVSLSVGLMLAEILEIDPGWLFFGDYTSADTLDQMVEKRIKARKGLPGRAHVVTSVADSAHRGAERPGQATGQARRPRRPRKGHS